MERHESCVARRANPAWPCARQQHRLSALLLFLVVSWEGCGDTNSPVLEGDSESVIALKTAGADVLRLPSFGGIDSSKGTIDYSRLPLQVDLSDVSVGPEIIEHLNNTDSVTELALTGPAVNDDMLSLLKNFKSLTSLDLSGSNVSDRGLEHLGASVKSLLSLNLDNTRVTGAGLVHLPQVGILSLVNTSFGDDDFAKLDQQKGLRFLTLTGTQATPAGLAKFKATRPHLLVMGIKQD